MGVIARTQKYFSSLPVIAEITHHQIIVATALASDATLFYAGLLHDILKPAFNFERTLKGWRWKHLNDVKIKSIKVNAESILKSLSFWSSLNVDLDKLTDLVMHHHDKNANKFNPISYIESKLELPLIETTLLPSRDFSEIGLHVCLEVVGLNHSYHYFILTLIYYGLKYYLNKLYGEIFKSFKLHKLIVDYYFGEADKPRINYKDGTLTISYFVKSDEFKGLHIRHEYSDDSEFKIDKKSDCITFYFSWSDILVYVVPYISSSGITYRIACVIPGLIKCYNGKIQEDSQSRTEFKAKVDKVIAKVISDLEDSIDLRESYNQLIINYLKGEERGNYSCLFCGKSTSHEVKLSRRSLLSSDFTDYHRIRGVVEDLKASVCPLCHVGFILEERFRSQGPISVLPLVGDPVDANISKDFEVFALKHGQLPINIERGVLPSIIGCSTLQLVSNLWYKSLLKEVKSRSINIPWIKAYLVRAQKDINDLYFKFFISRKILLYPILVKIRPRAIISSYGGRNKKFILNTDLLEGHLLWKGEEHDLIEEHLDALEPILEEVSKSEIMQKLYSIMVKLYGLR